MKKLISLALVFILAVSLCSCTLNGNKIRIGTAGLGGNYNELGNSLNQILSESDDFDCSVRITAGSSANLRLISQGYIEMAIAQADIAFDAYNGENSFSSNSYKGYGAVAGLYTEVCHIVVKSDSNLKSVNDLYGKTIGIGEKESGTELNANQILSNYGLSSKNTKFVNLDYSASAEKLKNGEIDAFFCTSGVGTTVISELAKQCDISFISIDDIELKKLKSTYSSFVDYTIPKSTYNGQDKDVKTLGVKALLLASDKVSSDKVEKITEMLYKNKDKLQYSVSTNLELDENIAVKGVTIPFHDGAKSYYKSKNITVE